MVDANSTGTSAGSPKPTLAADLIKLIREAVHEIQNDVLGAAPTVAELLRLMASVLDNVGPRDLDAICSIGIVIESVGRVMRDEALAAPRARL